MCVWLSVFSFHWHDHVTVWFRTPHFFLFGPCSGLNESLQLVYLDNLRMTAHWNTECWILKKKQLNYYLYRPLMCKGITSICMCVCQWKCPMASAAFTLTTGSGSWSSITKPVNERTQILKPANKQNEIREEMKGFFHFTFSDGAHVEVGVMLLLKISQHEPWWWIHHHHHHHMSSVNYHTVT